MSSSWRRARRHPSFAIGLALTAAIVVTAVCSLVYTPRDPLRMEITARLEPRPLLTIDDVEPNPPRTTTGPITSPKFGSAGSGGAELEPGPPRP